MRSRKSRRSSTRALSSSRRSSTSPPGWPTTTSPRRASATGWCCPPRACGRAGPSSVSRSRARARDDPVLRHLQDGPLRLSTLGKRLGRDPQGRVLRLRRAGLVEVEQDDRRAGLPRGARGGAGGAAGRSARPRPGGGRWRGCGPPGAERGWPTSFATVRRCGARSIAWPRAASCASSTSATCGSPAACRRARRRPSCATPDQEAALSPLLGAVEGGAFRPFLLHGVTGSGKTEVYFRVVEAALARGPWRARPRARDRPHPDARARGTGALRRHGRRSSTASSRRASGTTSGGGSARATRAWSWARAPRCSRRFPTSASSWSTRSTTGSYKQDDSPRYHGRDVAVMRARLEGCPVVLGSATPSVESHANALAGQVRAARPPAAHRPAGPAVGRDRGPPGGAEGGRRSHPEPGAPRRARGPPRPARAEPPAAEPPRLRHEPPVPRVRAGGHVPELLRDPHPPPAEGARRSATTAGTRRRRPPRARRATAPTCASPASARSAWRRRSRRRCPPPGSRGWTATAPDGAASSPDARRLREGRDRRPRRHPDDRQGPRLPARDARRRGGRRRGPRHAGLPLGGEDLPAPDPGGGPRRPRRGGGRGDPADATCPTTTPSGTPASRTTSRSSSGRWSSGARWATRRSPRS